MNLETQIKTELWIAISDSYESGNYTHAIKDAMSVITEVLRDKSGLDGDGDKLVGEALGFSEGSQPRIKINRLQTQTEKDMQRGLMFVLKGMYALIRNPRTHERSDDDKKTADTIILFIDHLLDFLGPSLQSFTVEDFLNLVTDPYFVQDKVYVKDLVDKIPVRKQNDTLIALYRHANWRHSNNFKLVIEELLARLTEHDIIEFLSAISEDLQKTNKIGDATLVIKILPEGLWPKLERMPRLRIENMLLNELETAWYRPEDQKTSDSASTWVSRIAQHYLQKDKLASVIIKKLRNQDFDHHNFVARYLMDNHVLPDICETRWQVQECVKAVAESIRSGNEYVKDTLLDYINWGSPEEWTDKFIENLKDLTDPENPEIWLADGTPFLGKFVSRPNPITLAQEIGEDEIPF